MEKKPAIVAMQKLKFSDINFIIKILKKAKILSLVMLY